MISDTVKSFMELIRIGASKMYSQGELSDDDYHSLLNLAESILREHEGE